MNRNVRVIILPILLFLTACGPSGQKGAETQKLKINPCGLFTPTAFGQFSDEIKNLPNPSSFLIIGQTRFSPCLQEFVKHKNAIGITTRFIDLESILQHYVGDEPSRVKQALAYAYMNKSTRYVMLVGDASLFPARHRFVSNGNEFGRPKNMTNDWWYDGVYVPTDYYYASLFHHPPGNVGKWWTPSMANYDDWDQSKNFKYDEEVWNWNSDPQHTPVTYNPDNVDAYPDLAVARLPIHNESDLLIYVDKAIKYDNGQMLPGTKAGITLVAGGSYPTSDDLCEQILEYNSVKDRIGENNILKLGINFPENGRSPKPGWDEGTFASIRNAVLKTWGLIYLGHGNAGGWGISEGSSGFNADEVNKFIGVLSLPVVFSISCETGQFKPVVPVGPYKDVYNQCAWYWQFDHDTISKSSSCTQQPDKTQPMKNLPTVTDPPGPYDLQDQANRTFACPWLFQKNEGGSIAYFGENEVCQDNHGRDLIERILSAYYNNKNQNILLGDIWIAGQQQFWYDYKDDGDVFQNPRIYLTIMTFFGDPTLRLPPPGSN